MAKLDNDKQDMRPIVKITLVNYDPAKQDEYSKKFMSPLIACSLKRIQLVRAK